MRLSDLPPGVSVFDHHINPPENTYYLLERGNDSAPFYSTSDFGDAGREALEYTRRTGRIVLIYDEAGYRGRTVRHKVGNVVSLQWSGGRTS